MPLNAVQDSRCQAVCFDLPSSIEPLTGVNNELQIAQVAMTQGMIAAKALRQSCLQCSIDLGTSFRIVQMWERTQSRQSYARCAMAPGEPEARVILVCR